MGSQTGKFALLPPPPTEKVTQKKYEIIPDYFYDDHVCGLSKASFLWWSNVVCVFSHAALAVATVVAATRDGTSMDTPRSTLYITELDWIPNATNSLVPKNKAVDGIFLSHLTLWFFLLSALAHLLIVVGNARQAWASNNPSNRKTTDYTGWYYMWIHECRQPLRWIEYSFSASVMIIAISVASGVNHVYMVTQIFVLMWATMVFGHYTEVLSRPVFDGRKIPQKWAVESRFQRLQPHLLGYVPFLTVWVTLMHSFFYNVNRDNEGPPSWVYVAVVGQAIVFSLFGLTQLLNQLSSNGPGWYYWGEWYYQLLSLLAKSLLGLTLLSNVLVYSSLDEALAA